ncbi:MAG: alpha/beta hydrolase [Promethearchaeota archaeon]
MDHQEGNLNGVGDLELYYQAWIPKNPKAIVQIIHGFGEHSGRYLNVVTKLVPFGYAIYINDQRGHGKSGGIRTYVDSFNQFVEDVKLFHDLIKQQYQNLPIFLLGHSMGSFIAVHFVYKYEHLLKGLILSGTGTFPSGILTNIILKRVQGLMRFILKYLPLIRMRIPLSRSISSDPKVSKAYMNDPLVVKTITLQLAMEMIYPIFQIKNIIRKFKLPLLIQCGSKDLLVIGINLLVSRLKMENQTIRIYQGLKHEVYNELEKDREMVLNELVEWLDQSL